MEGEVRREVVYFAVDGGPGVGALVVLLEEGGGDAEEGLGAGLCGGVWRVGERVGERVGG